ncbi:MAG: hypothetical protein IKB83_00005 [Mycoplasmataceae bacterium]|nr:hypothetical protein [bacterium]MBR2848878.1 hypothetical protein [Mycoplasmataceae bacterium]
MLYTKKEKIYILKSIQMIIENVDLNDEDLEYWLMNGIPDEPSEEDYNFIAEDDSLYNDILKTFEIVLREPKGVE